MMNVIQLFNKRFEKIKNVFSRSQKIEGNFDDYVMNHHLNYLNRDKSFSSIEYYYNCYYTNSLVRACVDVYVEESSLAGFSINNPSGDNDPSVHEYLVDLFEHPLGRLNSETFESFNAKIISSLLLTGDCFIEVMYEKGIPCGFSYIPPESMSYSVKGDCWKLRNSERYFEDHEIIHIFLSRPSLKNRKWGVSLLDSVVDEIMLINYANKYNKEIFSNAGINPSGILNFGADADSVLIESNIKNLEKNKAKTGMLVLQNAQYQPVSRSAKDLEFVKSYELARNSILSTFHVQPAKIGLQESASLGTGRGDSQDKAFAKALQGKTRIIENAFNRILHLAGFDEEFKYNQLNIVDESVKIQQYDVQIRDGLRTINEIRSLEGLDSVPWGDAPLSFSQFGLFDPVSDKVEPLAVDGSVDGGDITNPPTITEEPVTAQVKRLGKELGHMALWDAYPDSGGFV